MNLMSYMSQVQQVLDVPGTTLSPAFKAAEAGHAYLWQLAEDGQGSSRAALHDAISTGDPAAIRSAAVEHAALLVIKRAHDERDAAQQHVLATLRRAYAETALSNFEAIREQLNATLGELTKAARAVDLAAAAESILDAPATARTAWANAPGLSERAETLLAALHAAATLANIDLAHATHEHAREDQMLGLIATHPAAGEPMRALWRTWDEGGAHRAGRIAALIASGHKLDVPTAGDVKPLRRPRGIVGGTAFSGTGHRLLKRDEETGIVIDQQGKPVDEATTARFSPLL